MGTRCELPFATRGVPRARGRRERRERGRFASGLPWLSRFVLGSALSLACGDDEHPPYLRDQTPAPVRGCGDFSYTPCDILNAGCQGELFELMACIRGEEARVSQPPVALLDEVAALELISADPEVPESGAMPAMDATQDFAAQVRGLELLGLVEVGLLREESDVLDVTIQSVVAFYMSRSREIVIIDRGEPLDDLDANATLAHEFVHALQDARHGLGQFGAAHSGSSDSALAATSVVEGEATLYQLLMMMAYDGVDLGSSDFDATFDRIAAIGSEATREAGSPLLMASGIFPYTQGARYAASHWWVGERGALDALYEQPPSTSLEVMTGDAGIGDVVRGFDAAPEPLEGYELVGEDVVGAWVTFGVLAALAPQSRLSEIESLGQRWRGDHLWAYRNTDSSAAAALWLSTWDSESSAQGAAEWLRAWVPEGASSTVQVSGRSVRMTAAERLDDLEAWAARLAALEAP